MYAIVAFDDNNDTDFLPPSWAVDESIRNGDWLSLVKSGVSVKFYWPPSKNSDRVAKAKKKCIEPDLN